VPTNVNVTATYPIAVLKQSAHKDLAQEFVQFVLSREAQDVLHSYGFTPIS
jgi:molybdate transport system substrate-binding protein